MVEIPSFTHDVTYYQNLIVIIQEYKRKAHEYIYQMLSAIAETMVQAHKWWNC